MTDTKEVQPKKALFSDAVYNAVKNAAQYWLPALGALYAALAGLWGFPYATEVVGTIAAVDVFLGVLLGISAVSYNNSDTKYDGTLHVDESGTPVSPGLILNDVATASQVKQGLTLKVQTVPSDSVEPPAA
jgi:hypothetical protein